MSENVICTIASKNYYAKACTLVSSIRKFDRNIEVYVLIADAVNRNGEVIFQAENEECQVINTNALEIEDLMSYTYKYNLMEFNTFLKPFLLEYLMAMENVKKVIYLDPDIMVFDKLDSLFELLNRYSILLTPHVLSEKKTEIPDNTLKDLKYGMYNLGFIGLSDTQNARDFLDWWAEKLKHYCYLDLENYLAWDQKWCDLIPIFFDSVYIIRKPNYNVAFWNLFERELSTRDGRIYVNDEYPLIFYHFSQHRIESPLKLACFDGGDSIPFPNNDSLKEIYRRYREKIIENGHIEYSKLEYEYLS